MGKYLWKFFWNCGRMGYLESLFVTTEQEVKEMIGKKANFGEVLGKHSEIYGDIEESDVEKVDLDSETIGKVSKILGDTWCGYNPLYYIPYECSKCGSNYSINEFLIGENMCRYCIENEEE